MYELSDHLTANDIGNNKETHAYNLFFGLLYNHVYIMFFDGHYHFSIDT